MAPDDPIDELRAGWGGIHPREPGGHLEEEGADTRAVVGWLREAWAAVEAPTARVPSRPGLRRTAFWRRPARVAAAAALLAIAALGGWWIARGREGGTEESGDRRPPRVMAQSAPPTPRVIAVSEERVEMTLGRVHLILVPGTVSSEE